jgi:isopentenyl diphosphate isomerase/L-lactate dehydrogenase-like FMN-dependent dehydrogenase
LGSSTHRVPLIADGGVRRDAAIVQALLFGGARVDIDRHSVDSFRVWPCVTIDPDR